MFREPEFLSREDQSRCFPDVVPFAEDGSSTVITICVCHFSGISDDRSIERSVDGLSDPLESLLLLKRIFTMLVGWRLDTF